MKLRSFNAETCVNKRATGKPYISLHMKAGLFRVSHEACEKLGIKPGAKISLHQDEETPGDWYLLTDDAKGFEVRTKDNIGKGLLFSSTALAKEIAESVSFTGKSGRILVGVEAVKFEKKAYWPLITSSLKSAI